MRISEWSSDVCSSDLRASGRMKKPMSTIDPSRLLQMRSSILNQNQALQRAAGQGGIGAAGGGVEGGGAPDFGAAINNALQQVNAQQAKASHITERSEERRGGKECVSPGRARWSTDH